MRAVEEEEEVGGGLGEEREEGVRGEGGTGAKPTGCTRGRGCTNGARGSREEEEEETEVEEVPGSRLEALREDGEEEEEGEETEGEEVEVTSEEEEGVEEE